MLSLFEFLVSPHLFSYIPAIYHQTFLRLKLANKEMKTNKWINNKYYNQTFWYKLGFMVKRVSLFELFEFDTFDSESQSREFLRGKNLHKRKPRYQKVSRMLDAYFMNNEKTLLTSASFSFETHLSRNF